MLWAQPSLIHLLRPSEAGRTVSTRFTDEETGFQGARRLAEAEARQLGSCRASPWRRPARAGDGNPGLGYKSLGSVRH